MTTARRRLTLALGAGLIIAMAHWFDPWAYSHLALPSAGERDWGRMLRILGFAPTWGLVAALFWLESRRDGSAGAELAITARALLVAVILGGLASEIAKMLIRRERPADSGGAYQFRAFEVEPFNTSRLGMPSGHTFTAFAGAAALGRRYPKAAPLLLALAAGCGFTRVFAQAHFLSDVAAGAVGGTWIGRFVTDKVAGRPR